MKYKLKYVKGVCIDSSDQKMKCSKGHEMYMHWKGNTWLCDICYEGKDQSEQSLKNKEEVCS